MSSNNVGHFITSAIVL